MRKILRNRVRCKRCGEIIESVNYWDINFCRCGRVAVEGGKRYLGRIAIFSNEDYEELSEFEDGENPLPSPEK